MMREDVIQKIIEHSNEIKSEFGVKKLALFGSVARNENTEKSDLDFVVEYEKGKLDFHSYVGLAVYLEQIFNTKVDLALYNKLRPAIVNDVQRDLVMVFGEEKFFDPPIF
ncbi:MAG: nucleotidyltransferase family protein [Desulfitobacteriaceae bacterium]